jgi:hypothetical protein
MFPTKLRFIWSSGFRGQDFLKLANQKEELPVVAMLVNGAMFYRGPSIYVSYQVSVHLAEGFQRRRLYCNLEKNLEISE